MKKLLIAMVVALCLSGCVNVIKHVPPSQTVDVYLPTRFVACDAVGIWWNDTYNAVYPIEAAWMKLTWFVWIVDLPCEVVMDTLWFPYDFYRMKQHDAKVKADESRHGRFGAVPEAPQYRVNGEYRIRID